jgi:hypothetical protein
MRTRFVVGMSIKPYPKFTKHFEIGKQQNFERNLELARHISLSDVYHANILKMKKRVEILLLEH